MRSASAAPAITNAQTSALTSLCAIDRDPVTGASPSRFGGLVTPAGCSDRYWFWASQRNRWEPVDLPCAVSGAVAERVTVNRYTTELLASHLVALAGFVVMPVA